MCSLLRKANEVTFVLLSFEFRKSGLEIENLGLKLRLLSQTGWNFQSATQLLDAFRKII